MMLRHLLFAFLRAPEDDLGGGGGGAELPAAGGDVAPPTDPAPTIEDTARETYQKLMESGEIDDAGLGEEGDAKPSRQRGADGRFTKTAAEQAADAAAQQQPGVQPKPHDAYPNTWAKELQTDWTKIPENVRQQIHKREQDFHNGIRQYREAAGFGEVMAREMLPYQQLMRQSNVTPQAIVRDIMGALHQMVTGSEATKADVFLKLGNQYGINWDAVMTQRQRAPSQAAPELQPVLQRLSELETRNQQAEQERERQRREQDQAQAAEDDKVVTAFLSDPKNEHAKAVQAQMSALLLSGQAKDLQEAYDKAIWLVPEVRSKLLEKQEADRRKREADEAAAARKASATTVSRRGTPPAPRQKGSIEDTAREVYRRMNGAS